MPYSSTAAFRLFCLLAACLCPLRLDAQTLAYATGSFVTSCPAIIKAVPVGWSFPKAIDSVFVFETKAGNKVEFSLPVALATNAIRSGHPAASMPPARFPGPIRDAAGRNAGSRMGHRVCFTEASPFASALSAATRTSAVTLQYRFTIASQSPFYGDTSGILKTMVEKDNGVVEFLMPAIGGAANRFKELLAEAQYHPLFPNRYGFGKTGEASDGQGDFYSYAALIKAIDKLSSIRVKLVLRAGTDYAQKLVWTDTATGATRVMITHPDYDAEWNLDVKEDTAAVIRYADFCAEGTLETRKRELAAFFANVAHETGGGWEGAPNGGRYAWGLYWREEVAWQTDPKNANLGYVDLANATYPAFPGKSYHGRGPIQVSWNYNYGQVSEFLYGDKNILLRSPDLVLASGDVAFMTAIWFWMYPQGTIPAAHDIMTGKWKADAGDAAAGRDKSRFGATINVVNGAQECGHGADERVADRVGHFKWFSGIFGLALEPILDCGSQQPF